MMPFLIAHRGLLDGPDSGLENLPTTIELARSLGYDVEIDVWKIGDKWYLGHDAPLHLVDLDWLQNINQEDQKDAHHAWIHTKNIDALYALRLEGWTGHFFYHQDDDAVITSTGYLWTYPGRQLTPLSICVMPEWTDSIHRAADLGVAGFCSDFIREIETILR